VNNRRNKAIAASKPSECVLGEPTSKCHIIYGAISLVEDFVRDCVVHEPYAKSKVESNSLNKNNRLCDY
jgi:hypothetical protein